MSVSQSQGLKFQSSVLLNAPNRNGKYNPGVKRVTACLLFSLLLKAAQQLLLSLALRKTEGKGRGSEQKMLFPFSFFKSILHGL